MIVDSTEVFEAVPVTEIIEDSEVNDVQVKENVSRETQEVSSEVEAFDASTLETGTTVQTVDYSSSMDFIANDVHIIMFIVLFSFCWSCMKSWRTHSLKGVRK